MISVCPNNNSKVDLSLSSSPHPIPDGTVVPSWKHSTSERLVVYYCTTVRTVSAPILRLQQARRRKRGKRSFVENSL